MDAAKEKNYSLAITYFNQVIDREEVHASQLPLVYFNLGVCYYRAGQFDLANKSFKRSMDSDVLLWRSVFNLALVAESQQRWTHAARLYDKIVADSDQAELIALAKKKRTQLPAGSSLSMQSTSALKKRRQPSAWTGTVYAGIGLDDDVIDPKDLTGSGSDDTFYEVYGGAYRPLFVNDSRYLLVKGQAYTTQYSAVEEFDINLLKTGLEYRWRLDEQLLSAGLSIEHSTVGSNDYLFQQALFASSRWALRSKSTVLAKYEYRDYDALDSLFDPLAGSAQEVELVWQSPWISRQRWQISLFVIDDDRADRLHHRGISRFSALRRGGGLHWRFRNRHWRCSVDLQYRSSDYEGVNLLPDRTLLSRQDERYQTRFSWQYSIAPDWDITLEYEYTRNKSNIDIYDYHSGVATSGVKYNF